MLNYLRLTNFQKHEHFEHTFAPGLSVCVGPNWSGKSSLLRGLLYGLFGASAVSVGAKNLVTRHAAGALEVGVDFTVGGVRYEVRRGLSKAELRREGNLLATGQTAVTAQIEELIGPAKQFLTYQVSRQGEAGALLTLGSTKLAQHINAVTGVDLVDRVLDRIKDERLLVKGATEQVEGLSEQWQAAQAQYQQHTALIAEKTAEQSVLMKGLETLQKEMGVSYQQVTQLQSQRQRFVDWQRQEAERRQQLADAELRLKVARGALEAAPAADSREALSHYQRLEEGARRRPEALSKRDQAQTMLAQADAALEQLRVELCEPVDTTLMSRDAEHWQEKAQQLTAEIRVREQSLQASICPACQRPLAEGGCDHAGLEAQLEKLRAELAVAQEQATHHSAMLRETQEHNQRYQAQVTSREQWAAYGVQAQTHLDRLEEELALYPEVTAAEVQQAQATYRVLQAQEQAHVLAQMAVQVAEENLARVPGQGIAVPEVTAAEVDAASQHYAQQFYQHLEHSKRSAELEGELQTLRQAVGPLQQQVEQLAQQRAVAERQAERDRGLEALGKYLRTNRDRFMQSAWDNLLGYASTFIRDASQQAITELRRDAKGEFTYVENGQELPLELASGMQLAILGVAVKLALAAAIGSTFDVLLLDEVSAAASDENALRLTECLAATGQQVFLITHREADAVAAQDVIALS